MDVKKISDYRSRETVAALTHLLDRAKRGELLGVGLYVLPFGSKEEILFTDLFRRDPNQAVQAALRLSKRMNEISAEIAGSSYG